MTSFLLIFKKRIYEKSIVAKIQSQLRFKLMTLQTFLALDRVALVV